MTVMGKSMSEVTLSKNRGMQITLINEAKDDINTLWLPEGEPVGRYTLEEYEIDCFYLEACNGSWNAVCRNGASFVNCVDCQQNSVSLENQSLIKIDYEGRQYVVFAEQFSDDNMIFLKYAISNADEIRIGRSEASDIRVGNGMVSGQHALLKYNGSNWEIHDLESTNGTYVNNKRIRQQQLKCGDLIYILGLKIIVGIGFLAMNVGGKSISINNEKLQPINGITGAAGENANGKEDIFFNRQPRRRKALKFEDIVVEAPPMSMNSDKMPLFLRMGNTVFSGTTAMLAGNVTSAVSSLLFPLLTNNYTEKEKKEYEEKRKSVYLGYLQKKTQQIEDEKRNEEHVLRWNYPDLSTVLDMPGDGKRLWERKKIDDDFLLLRVGEGNRKLIAKVTFPNEQLEMNEDELENKMRELAKTPVVLSNVPIQTSLIEDFVCGIEGSWKQKIEFVRNLLLQLTITHSYDEVKVVFLGDHRTVEAINFVRYLPHIWNDERDFRFLASSPAEAFKISEYLKNEMTQEDGKFDRQEIKEILKTRPYYVVIAFDKKCFDCMEILKDLLQEEKSQGISILAAFDDLPKECSKLFKLKSDGNNEVISLREIDREIENFVIDPYYEQKADQSIKMVSNTRLKAIEQSYSLPKMITFLEMFGVGRIEHLNIENRWMSNNPIQSLATPIGIATDGSTFNLDLHQKFQGPHGLVAGTTGSGKSEFLLTYILSMAVNYHPNEVAFVLIDYKGGGLAGAFDDPEHGIHLPHLVGTITNLDGSSIQRSLISIQSELIRRQKVFNDVKNATGEGTMDIYTYQRLFRNGKISDPMPHLFIISDEFAELKQQEPEFMEKLISAARIGRSLGIHLILATQKPSGVVNDQIRSNTKFRVCLKVQDRADSNDMLERPEAAELKDTGRFYLQVGSNEFFALGQSAWSGADYTPQNEVIVQRDESVQMIDANGQNLVVTKKKFEVGEAVGTQLVSVVRYISDIALKRNISTRQLWKPQLAEYLRYDTMAAAQNCEKTGYEIITYPGFVDDPENQKQFPLKVDMTNCNNLLIIGDIGCGKSTMLQTMLFDLAVRYSPEEVIFYLIDCSAHLLRVFKDLPHCGAWLMEEDESDIDRLFVLLNDEVKRRKKLFAEADATSYEMYVRKKKLPLMLFVIDNAAGLTATKNGNEYYSSLGTYMKQCSGLGIQFVITVSNLNELYSKTKQEISTRIALEMKDKYNYGDALNVKCDYLPAKKKGRGLACVEERPLEFQTAIVTDANGEYNIEWIRNRIGEIAGKYVGMETAQKLPMLDAEQEYEDFCRSFSKGRIPLGYSLQDMKQVALPIKQLSMLSIYFGNAGGILPIFQNMLYAARQNELAVKIIKRQGKSCFETMDAGEQVSFIECNEESIYDFILEMTEFVKPRIQHLQKYTREHGLKASRKDIYMDTYSYMSTTQQPLLVIMESFSDICNALQTSENDQAFGKILNISRNLGIYYIAGFYPGEKLNSAYEFYKNFNPEKVELYLGGQLDKQPLESLPSELAKVSGEMPYHQGIMHYKDKFYPLLMPCGVVTQEEKAEDDKNIF